ncbi:GumC family protein [Solirhodobacter olei]|uniref:GumC family protein n=1 Tax=Solirhodobacter olei TaxID=2493082 RepID=UPI000FD84112|nr:Wzz/FepE/Etk N-terminal domain-containing protein [Solirhodobacter olei]
MNSRLLPFDTAAAAVRRHVRPISAPDRVDVRDLWALVWRRRRIVLGAMGAGFVLALLVAFFMTPEYSATSKVMLEARAPQTAAPGQVVPETQVNDQVVNSVVTVIESNVLIRKAIEEIGADKLSAIDPANRAPSLLARIGDGLAFFLPSSPKGPSLISPQEAQMQRLIYVVTQHLKVTRETQANVVDIVVSLPDRVVATRIANALANEFIVSQVKSRQLTAGDATKGLEARLAQMKADVEKAEAAVDKYRAANLITDGGTLDAATQQLGQLNNQLVLARSDRIAAEAAYGRLKDVIAKKGYAGVGDLVSSPVLDQLNTQLMTLQRQDQIWAQNYGPQHPERIRLAGEIKGVKGDIAAEVQKLVEQKKSAVAQAELREKTMQQSIAAMESRVVKLSQSTIGLRQRERVASSARAAYNNLLNRVNDSQTEAAMQQPDSQLIEQATIPSAPSAPKTKLMAVLGALGGLVIGFGAVFFQELTSPSFAHAADLEEATGLPVLTSIPDGGWSSTLDAWEELAQKPYGLFAERIRHLRTALITREGGAPRSLLLASSVPDEGKTTTALTLARMAALAGRKVILIDGDLRRSSLSQTFGWSFAHDFADFIANRCPLGRAIRRDKSLGFDVLATAGPRPDAADELSADWLKPMMESLKGNYDLIIVDAPASLAVADALVLAQAVDECLYLVRWRETPRQAVAKGLAQFAEAGANVSGMVLTQVDPRTGSDVYAGDYDYSA